MSEFFASDAFQTALDVLKNQFPLAIWETVYVTVLSTFFAIVIGLPLGVLLVAGDEGHILHIPKGVLHVLNVIINLLRSVPFPAPTGGRTICPAFYGGGTPPKLRQLPSAMNWS